VAIIEIRRTAFEESGAPLRLTVTTCPADRNELQFNTGRVPGRASPPESANGTAPVARTKKPSSG
jgi:GntR family transcriptional regulator